MDLIIEEQRKLNDRITIVEQSNKALTPEKAQQIVNDHNMLLMKVAEIARVEEKVDNHIDKINAEIFGADGIISIIKVAVAELSNVKQTINNWGKAIITVCIGIFLGAITVGYTLLEKRLERPPGEINFPNKKEPIGAIGDEVYAIMPSEIEIR